MPTSNKSTEKTISCVITCLSNIAQDHNLTGLRLLIYGSIASGAQSPSDVDLLLIYRSKSYEAAVELRKSIRAKYESIRVAVGIPVNLMVLSDREYQDWENNLAETVEITNIL